GAASDSCPSVCVERACPVAGAWACVPPDTRTRSVLIPRIQLQFQVLEAHFHRPTRVELQSENAVPGAGRIVDVHAQLAVEVRPDLAAYRDDLVTIPLVRLQVGLARLVPQQAPAVLLVQLAPPAGADVGLIAFHLAVRQGLTAELHAAVALAWCQLDLERQAEIAGDHLADQELVALQAGTLADDLPLLDLPQLRIADPAGQVLAVEERLEIVRRRQDRHLPRARQVGDQRPHLLVLERLEQVVRHHRQIARLDRVDLAARDDDRLGRRYRCPRFLVLLLDDAGDDAPLFRLDDAGGILLRHDRRRINDVRQQIVEVGAIGTGQLGADLAAAVEQRVTLLARLGEDRPSQRQVVRRRGPRLDELLQVRNEAGLVLRCLADGAPDGANLLVDVVVLQVAQLPDKVGGQVGGGHLLRPDRREQGLRVADARAERRDGVALFSSIQRSIKTENDLRRFRVVVGRQAAQSLGTQPGVLQQLEQHRDQLAVSGGQQDG